MVVFNFQTQKLAKLGQKTSKTAKIETSKPATAETQKAESVYILGNDRWKQYHRNVRMRTLNVLILAFWNSLGKLHECILVWDWYHPRDNR